MTKKIKQFIVDSDGNKIDIRETILPTSTTVAFNMPRMFIDHTKIATLENILDTLCKLTDRNLFVVLPEKEEEQIPYLIKEIKITLDRI